MVPKSDFPDIDWANEDVSRIVEIFSEKFDVMMQKKDEVIDKLAEENKQLRQEIERLKSTGGGARAGPAVTMRESSRIIRGRRIIRRGAGRRTPATMRARTRYKERPARNTVPGAGGACPNPALHMAGPRRTR